MKIIRARAPLRLGLAGGGTDVSPFCDLYGGLTLNATINRYAYCTLIPQNTGMVEISQLYDDNCAEVLEAKLQLEPIGSNLLAKAVYNRMVADFNRGQPLGLKMTTASDAPPGSGLGSSSTLIVSMIQAFCELLALPLNEYEIASLAYRIERIDLGQRGGHQDQYAATFGGINYMEFQKADRVLVNPLRVKDWIIDELESCILLYYTSVSRFSSAIIDEQIKSVEENSESAMSATHQLKEDALAMKEALLTGKIRRIADIVDRSWEAKKKMASCITNDSLDTVMRVAKSAGAYAGKVSGAGGGGFIMLIVNPLDRRKVEMALSEIPGYFVPFQFEKKGARAWTVWRGAEGTV